MATTTKRAQGRGQRRRVVPDVLGDVGAGAQTVVLHLHRTRREVFPLVTNADMRRYVRALKKQIEHLEGMVRLIESIMEDGK